MSPLVEELEAELVALRRHNEQIRQLAEQAIRMGEKPLGPARDVVIAHRQYAILVAQGTEAADLAYHRLVVAVDKLSRQVANADEPAATQSRGDRPSICATR